MILMVVFSNSDRLSVGRRSDRGPRSAYYRCPWRKFAMYRTAMVDGATPHSARVLVARVSDLFLMDVHAMLRLPRGDVGITQACNFTIASTLMNFISGVSVTLFEPPADRQGTGRKFR